MDASDESFVGDAASVGFARMCLLSRRLVERGVRFVQLHSGSGSKWDAHKGIEANHSKLCRGTDQPIAGLLRDLKQGPNPPRQAPGKTPWEAGFRSAERPVWRRFSGLVAHGLGVGGTTGGSAGVRRMSLRSRAACFPSSVVLPSTPMIASSLVEPLL